MSACPRDPPAPTILHADLDAFFASVEQRDDPRLRGRPVLVGGGVVLAASYEARAFGVRGAMGGRQALRLCPGAVVVPPRFDAYVEASRAVFDVFADTSPLVEGISIDEAFLDVGGLRRVAGPAVDVAVALRRRVREEVGLPITVGVARTKFLAKVASAAGKPDGLLVVDATDAAEIAFLHPLPVQRLWGVGPVTAAKLHGHGLHTVGEVAAVAESTLAAIVGRAAGHHLWALAQRRDPRRVTTGRRRRSIGSQHALGSRPRPWADIEATLLGITDRVCRRLRAGDRVGRTIVLRLRYADFTRATRSATLDRPTASTSAILTTARTLLRSARPTIEEQGLTLLGLAITNLEGSDPLQLSLPFTRGGRGLDDAIDAVREKYGTAALTRTTLLRRSTGVDMPTLPDGPEPEPSRRATNATMG